MANCDRFLESHRKTGIGGPVAHALSLFTGFELDAGDLGKRQIFSGIRASYGEPEALVGRSVVFIANLAPRKMRFGLSEGMILSAGFDGGALALLDADSGAQPGMPVR